MSNITNLKIQTADFAVTVNNATLSSALQSTLLKITVEDEINVPAMFTIRFSTLVYNAPTTNIGFDIFQPGDVVGVSLGFSSLQQLMTGLVTSVEANFSNNENAFIDVRGQDRLCLLNFGTNTRVFNTNDSAIATMLAQEVGLTPQVDSAIETSEAFAAGSEENIYVYQNNQSNYSFLLSRCYLLNYEMFVNDTNFIFRQSQCGQAPTLTLEFGLTIDFISLRLKVLNMGSSVEVLSWNALQKQTVSSTVDSGSLQAKMGGLETGFEISANNFPSSATSILDQNVLDSQQAQLIAQAQYNIVQNYFIEGEGYCIGNPQLRAGINIQITEINQRFAGLYYVIATTHKFDISSGYVTHFKLIRSGI